MGDIYRNAERVVVFLGSPDRGLVATEGDASIPPDYASSEVKKLFDMQARVLIPMEGAAGFAIDTLANTTRHYVYSDVVLLKGLLLCSMLATYILLRESREMDILERTPTSYARIETLPQMLLKLAQDDEAWQGILAIAKRSDKRSAYFRRRWIFQEAAPGLCLVHISGFRIHMHTLLMGLNTLISCRTPDPNFSPLSISLPASAVETVFRELYVEIRQAMTLTAIRECVLDDAGLGLLFLLDNCSASEYLDPRDAFYAVRSLVSARHTTPPSPDYNLPAIDVVHQHLLYLLKEGHGPSMLQKAGLHNGPQRIEGLPSWCPGWFGTNAVPRPTRYILDLNSYACLADLGKGDYPFKSTPEKQLRAGIVRPVCLKWNDETTMLSVKGTFIGTVTDSLTCNNVADSIPALVESVGDPKLLTVSEAALAFARSHSYVGSDLISSESLSSRYVGPMEAEFIRLGMNPHEQLWPYFDLQNYLYQVTCQSKDRFPHFYELDQMLLQRSLSIIHIDEALMACFLGLDDLGADRPPRLSVIGIGPRIAQKGDIVVVFDGFATPTVLRPTYHLDDGLDGEMLAEASETQKYQVVGDAHLMQLVDGHLLERAKVDSQEFVLV